MQINAVCLSSNDFLFFPQDENGEQNGTFPNKCVHRATKATQKDLHENVEDKDIIDDDDFDEEKARRLLTYEEAPEYLKHNSFILSGYRGILNTKLCMERQVTSIHLN